MTTYESIATDTSAAFYVLKKCYKDYAYDKMVYVSACIGAFDYISDGSVFEEGSISSHDLQMISVYARNGWCALNDIIVPHNNSSLINDSDYFINVVLQLQCLILIVDSDRCASGIINAVLSKKASTLKEIDAVLSYQKPKKMYRKAAARIGRFLHFDDYIHYRTSKFFEG